MEQLKKSLSTTMSGANSPAGNCIPDGYIMYDHKKLRLGYTTGSCAAAAAKAATAMLLTSRRIEEIALMTPKGIGLHLLIEDCTIRKGKDGIPVHVRCAVRKDGGDDIDATDGALVYADVEKCEPPGDINPADADTVHQSTELRNHPENTDDRSQEERVLIDGGEGVGRVTLPGLDQPVGNAAINHVPRQMIRENVAEVCEKYGYNGWISVVISVPDGAKIAEKTFNPRLGIVGGISILGTSGIVFPMSEQALVDAIRVEMRVQYENGGEYLVMTPGNFGERFAAEMPGLDTRHEMKCSNFVGETIDMAVDIGVKGILFISHIGKFIKVSGGIMNTHSRQADCRAELMAAAVIRAGGTAGLAGKILETPTTEEALRILMEEGGRELFDRAMQKAADRMNDYLQHRAGGKLMTGAVIFSNVYGKLAQTKDVPALMDHLVRED